jgi:hypothetical protein
MLRGWGTPLGGGASEQQIPFGNDNQKDKGKSKENVKAKADRPEGNDRRARA